MEGEIAAEADAEDGADDEPRAAADLAKDRHGASESRSSRSVNRRESRPLVLSRFVAVAPSPPRGRCYGMAGNASARRSKATSASSSAGRSLSRTMLGQS